jgi:geranylgeranyl pyrophosphate synthase
VTPVDLKTRVEEADDLVELLERELAPAIEAATGDIDRELWEQSLVGLAREILGRPGKQFRARLVELAWGLSGSQRPLSPRFGQLVELVHAGSLIVDDIEDDSGRRRGRPSLHRICGLPLALNTGNWLYFAAYHLIDRLDLGVVETLGLYRRLSATMFRCHQGQALDLAIDVAELRQRDVARLADAAARLKAGELMSFAAELGAMAGGAGAEQVASLARFGESLGGGLQHLDDLGGLRCAARRDKGREDLAGRRLTWPWAYLAGELDEVRFHGLQSKLRHARAGDLDSLADELAELLGDGAYRRACALLEAAVAPLHAAFAGSPLLAEVESEIDRLERSYG